MRAREFGDELLRGLLEHASRALPGAVGVGLLTAEQEEPVAERRRGGNRSRLSGNPAAPPVTTTVVRVAAAIGVAAVLDPAQVVAGVGPAWDGLAGQLVALAPAEDEEQRWAALEAAAPGAMKGVRGVVVVPAKVTEDGAAVLLTTYLDRPPGRQHLAELELIEPLLNRGLALAQFAAAEEVKADQMLQMIQYRRVIEQAKGLVLAAVGGDAPSAFSTLSRASQHFNVRLRNLAVALVEYVGDGPAEHPDDPELMIHPGEADRQAAMQVWAALSARPQPAESAGQSAGQTAGKEWPVEGS